MLPKCVFESVPEICGAFHEKMQFLTLTGSFAVNEETFASGKYLSDIDYYVVLRKTASESECKLIAKNLKLKLNECASIPKSIWVVSYDNFYNSDSFDTLSPYQVAETNIVLFGSPSCLDSVKNKTIKFNSHVGLYGVACMHLLNGIDKSNIISLIKGTYEQIGVWLISRQKYRTKYADRLDSFMTEFPKFAYMYDLLIELINIKKTFDELKFYKLFNTMAAYYEFVKPLFDIKNIGYIFGVESTVKSLCERIVNSSKERYVRASYIAYLYGDFDLANKYCMATQSNTQLNDRLLDRINYAWSSWLQSEGVFEANNY